LPTPGRRWRDTEPNLARPSLGGGAFLESPQMKNETAEEVRQYLAAKFGLVFAL